MPMLGDMLAAARDSSGSFLAWLERSDPEDPDLEPVLDPAELEAECSGAAALDRPNASFLLVAAAESALNRAAMAVSAVRPPSAASSSIACRCPMLSPEAMLSAK